MRPLRSRRSRVVALVVGAALAVLAAGLVLSALGSQEDDAVAPLFEDDFSSSSGLWNERADEDVTVRVADGALELRAPEEGTLDVESPELTLDLEAVRIESTARVAGGGQSAVVGLFCAESEADASRRVPAGGWAFVLHPASRTVRIGRIAGPLDRDLRYVKGIAEHELPDALRPGAETRLRADCVGSGDATHLSFWVDGRRVLSAPPQSGSASFGGAGVVVLNAGGGPADVRFDDFSIRDGA